MRFHMCGGTYTYKNGNKYGGEWKDGKESGQGTDTWSSGYRHVGELKDGAALGQDTFIWADGGV